MTPEPLTTEPTLGQRLKERLRQQEIADVFAREGVQGLKRRGLLEPTGALQPFQGGERGMALARQPGPGERRGDLPILPEISSFSETLDFARFLRKEKQLPSVTLPEGVKDIFRVATGGPFSGPGPRGGGFAPERLGVRGALETAGPIDVIPGMGIVLKGLVTGAAKAGVRAAAPSVRAAARAAGPAAGRLAREEAGFLRVPGAGSQVRARFAEPELTPDQLKRWDLLRSNSPEWVASDKRVVAGPTRKNIVKALEEREAIDDRLWYEFEKSGRTLTVPQMRAAEVARGGIERPVGAVQFEAMAKALGTPAANAARLSQTDLEAAAAYARGQKVLTPRERTIAKALETQLGKRIQPGVPAASLARGQAEMPLAPSAPETAPGLPKPGIRRTTKAAAKPAPAAAATGAERLSNELTRLQNSSVRKNGMVTSNNASVERYLKDLHSLVERRRPDLLYLVDEAIGEFSQQQYPLAMLRSEQALGHLHMDELLELRHQQSLVRGVEQAQEAVAPTLPKSAPAAAGAPPVQPPRPPVAQAAPPPTVPPPSQAPQGIQETLVQARAIVQRDRSGIITRLNDYVPGLKQIRHRLQPALDQPETITTGWVGQGLARAKVETALQQTRIDHLAKLEEVFGKGATTKRDFKPVGIAFSGTPSQAQYPYVGTLADIMTRPSLYKLSAEQKAALAAIQNARSTGFESVKAAYNLDLNQFPVESGGVHLPNVDISEDAIEMSGNLQNALRRGRTKQRFYATAAERWAHDKTFRPETTVSKLLAANDQTLADMAGQRVFLDGAGGKTRLEVMQATHPELAAKMEALKAKLASVRSAAIRLGGKQSDVIDDFLASSLDDADLAMLQADLNPTIGANAVGRQGVNFGKDIKTLQAEVALVKRDIAVLRPSWNVANLKPYSFVQEGVYRYFPVAEAKQVRELLKVSNSPVLKFVDDLRATAFGGDLSPISIQGATAWLSDPIGVSRFIAQGKGGLTQAAILADMKANSASWQRFIGATGINPLGSIEQEFATGFLTRIPKVGKVWEKWNEALYRPITRLQKNIFDVSYEGALRRGLSAEQAAAIGADDATKIIPRYNFRRLGQAQADAARLRGVLTSVSFLTQPAALMGDALKGLGKLGLKQTLTPSERFAVQRVVTLAVTAEAIAVLSAIYYAKTHEQDVEQAIKDALNPASGKFMSLILPNGARVGLGGPFRSLTRAVWPKEVPGVPVPLPFAGLYRFGLSKMGPALRITWDEIRNRDYYGKKIRTGDFPINILQGLEYAMEGAMPLTGGSALQQLRRGESPGVVGQEAASQFLGTNYSPADPVYDAKVHWDKDFKAYRDIPTNIITAKREKRTTREAYRKKNPEIDAKLFLTGAVDTPLTFRARMLALQYMKELHIRVSDIKSLEAKPDEAKSRTVLRQWFQRRLGEPQSARQPSAPAATQPTQSHNFAQHFREAVGAR